MSSEIYKKLLDYMTKLQPNANKKDKKSALKDILLFLNNNEMEEADLMLLFTGDEDKKIIGLCDLVGKKNSAGKFKDSAKTILGIIHDLMYLSKRQNKFREDFVIYDDFIRNMQLGEHYCANKTKDTIYAKKVIEVIKVVVEKRPGLNMNDYIKRAYIDEVTKGLEEYGKLKKRDEERKNEKAYYIDKLVSDTAGSISLEPKTWDDVTKLKNKKLLTTEFLSLNYHSSKDKPTFIDEDKELEEEILNNFVDPLTRKSKKLNFVGFSEDERRKMHLQCETFDSVYFLEKLYADLTLREFGEHLKILEENLQSGNMDDGSLIDKNIYKYLDCKKLLDYIVEKFKTSTQSTYDNFKETLTNLQNRISFALNPLKTSFDLILKSKSSKEIILKFSKFFFMKEKIEHYMKFSNFEDLADYLKKINVEIKEISQNRYIYGDFYDFFSKTIEHFKGVLIKLIRESSVNDLVIKHFRYLLEFDVEADTVDYLLNGLKEKMCEKIKNDLEYTENFEIRNFKEFFCDEFNVENINEETFAETLKLDGYSNTQVEDLDTSNKNKDDKKKNLINVESILTTLYNEIKDFLFMMKVLEENINLKIIHLSSQKNTKFSTTVTEVYFTLFEKLKQFLFLSDFNMLEILKNNYNEEKISKTCDNAYKFEHDQISALFNYYEKSSSTANTLFNENFNKNALQNLSNLLIDLFDLFEVYLDRDTLEALNESKTVTIEKIFMAFLNEKIIFNLNICNEESTINFFDTQLSIFNFSAFSFTKTFIKNIFKSYKNIIEFYLNILSKTKDVNLNHEVIYYSLFFLLKSFVLKFWDFYQTEANGPEDYKRLNCLILEILKNYNYMKLEIKTILKTIFKNKVKEYEIYLVDLENFMTCLINVFIKEYVSNASKVLFNLFVPIEKSRENIVNLNINPLNSALNNAISYNNYSYSFYEKYNDLLLYDYMNTSASSNNSSNKNGDISIFTDIRSCLIEVIINLAESIKVFYQLEQENSLTNSEVNKFTVRKTIQYTDTASFTLSNERLISIISDIIYDFLDNLYTHLDKENKALSSPENFKLLTQLYMEIELFQNVLYNFISSRDSIVDKLKNVNMILFYNLLSIKNKRESVNADESIIFTRDEIDRKNKVIEEYSSKYSSYFKCFKIKS